MDVEWLVVYRGDTCLMGRLEHEQSRIEKRLVLVRPESIFELCGIDDHDIEEAYFTKFSNDRWDLSEWGNSMFLLC